MTARNANGGVEAVETAAGGAGATLPPEVEVDIPEPDAPKSVSKYARFIVSEDVIAAQQETAHACMWGSPPKTSYVQIHPDKGLRLGLRVMTHDVAGQRKTYLIDPDLEKHPDLEGLTKIVQVHPYITHHTPGKLGLWPVSVGQERNPWVQSAMNIIRAAEKQWLKVIPVKARGEYITRPPAIPFGAPRWDSTPTSIDVWLDLAFTETDWLTPSNWADHPLRQALQKGD